MAQRQFDIEMIVFKRKVDAEKTTESWPNQLEAIDFSNAALFSDSDYRRNKGVTVLPASSYRLNRQYNSLKNHAGYEVLLHTAWRQGDQGKAYAPIFRIQAGKDYSRQFNQDGSPLTAIANGSTSSFVTNSPVVNSLYELDGKFQIYVQHYLFADINLDLKQPAIQKVRLKEKTLLLGEDTTSTVQSGNLMDVTPTTEVETRLKTYRLDQNRRIKSGETHYLDHPLMGIILQIRRAQ